MATSAYTCGILVKRGDGASPEVFTTLTEAYSMSGLGKTNALIEVTHFNSSCIREYIGGLADGTEVTIECNLVNGDTQQEALITDVNNRTTRNFQVTMNDGSTTKTYAFALAMLTWTVNPSVDDRHTITYVGKVTGNITIT